MVVIVTADIAVAKALDAVVEGERAFIVLPEQDLVAVDDHPDQHAGQVALRAAIHPRTPEVVVLDVRFGGNGFRVMRSIPKIASGSSRPAVLLLLPRRTRAVIEEAGRLGCFDAISLSDRFWKRKLVGAIVDAKAARLAGALESPTRRARRSLH